MKTKRAFTHGTASYGKDQDLKPSDLAYLGSAALVRLKGQGYVEGDIPDDLAPDGGATSSAAITASQAEAKGQLGAGTPKPKPAPAEAAKK